jgi:hypothetical protein
MNTQPVPHLTDAMNCYVYISTLSDGAQQAVHRFQDELAKLLPGVLWMPRGGQLHVTLLHTFGPLFGLDSQQAAEFDQNYEDSRTSLLSAMQEAVAGIAPIKLRMQQVKASENAVFGLWQDEGQYEEIRERFVTLFEIPPGTQRRPNIVHTTIARYQRPIALEEVQQAVDSLTLEAEMTVEEIILIRETRAYGQQYTVAERIPLH